MMFSGMPLAMRVEYAVFIMAVLPLIVPIVVVELVRAHFAATATRLRSEGSSFMRLLPYGALASLIVFAVTAALVFGMNSMGDMASTAGADSTSFGGALMICGITIMLCALTMVTLAVVAMTSSTVGELLRMTLGLSSTLSCDRHVADAARSWARPQWVPCWARFSLPDPRI